MVKISCPSLIYHYVIYWTDTPLRFTAKIFASFILKELQILLQYIELSLERLV